MPVDVAMEEPRAGVVSGEAEDNFLPSVTRGDDITDDGVVPVVGVTTGAADNPEVVLWNANHEI